MVKVLITGVDGYIGSRVAAAMASTSGDFQLYGLSRRSHSCHCEDHRDKAIQNVNCDSGLPRSHALPRNDGVQNISGDFTNKDRMVEILSKSQPDVIIHCAGMTPHKDNKDGDYGRVNFEGGKVLLESVRDYNKNRMDCHVAGAPRNDGVKFINCSTIGVYGTPLNDNGVVLPSDVCHPSSPYAQSKYDFEQHLSRQTGISYLNLRIANIPGRDAFINYVLNGHHVTFNGDIPYIRDYIHLDDLSDLFLKSIIYLMDGGENATLNAGSGVGLSFPDIVDEVEGQSGKTITRHHAPTKTGDVVRIICDISDTKKRLGWNPRHTNLDQIIRYAIDNKSL